MPCDYQTYCGSGPASELETQAIQTEVSRIASEKNLWTFTDVHTFGQMILMPYRYEEEFTLCFLHMDTYDNISVLLPYLIASTQVIFNLDFLEYS